MTKATTIFEIFSDRKKYLLIYHTQKLSHGQPRAVLGKRQVRGLQQHGGRHRVGPAQHILRRPEAESGAVPQDGGLRGGEQAGPQPRADDQHRDADVLHQGMVLAQTVQIVQVMF